MIRKMAVDWNMGVLLMEKGEMRATMAITRVLVQALPRTSPMTRLVWCCFMAARTTDISGKLVPIERRRVPMIMGGREKRLEILTEERTMALEERKSPRKPMTNKKAV